MTADALQSAQTDAAHELDETQAAIERLASASARSEALRMSIDVLKTSGPILANLMAAEVKWPNAH